MNVYELEKLATPGPYVINKWPDGSVVLEGRWFPVGQVFARKAGEGASTWKAKNPEATANLLAHCRNNFMKALEALKTEHDTSVAYESNGLYSSPHCPEICDVCQLIKELEEVK